MTYKRVIPRDFFNEAKLLKCMGHLALKVHDGLVPEGITISIRESGKPFEIILDHDGHLWIKNYPVLVNGKGVIMKTVYNSKSPYPFYCEIAGEEITVFDDDGHWDQEFLDYFQNE